MGRTGRTEMPTPPTAAGRRALGTGTGVMSPTVICVGLFQMIKQDPK